MPRIFSNHILTEEEQEVRDKLKKNDPENFKIANSLAHKIVTDELAEILDKTLGPKDDR